MNCHLSRNIACCLLSYQRLFVTLVVLMCSAALPIAANPLIGDAIFTHVQTTDPQFCDENDITDCEMISQYTSENGILDFALFYQPLMQNSGEMQWLVVDVYWPEEWEFVNVEPCVGLVEHETTDFGATFTFYFTDELPTADAFFLIGKVTLNVTSRGRSGIGEFFYITVDGDEYPGSGFGARAGYDCGNCAMDCYLADSCWPYFGYSDIQLVAPQGETAVFEFEGWASGMDPLCDVYFSEAVEWIHLEVVEVGIGSYEITLTADATNLTPGIYEGYIEATSQSCSLCRYVVFEVTDLSPIETVTWGRIKADYR